MLSALDTSKFFDAHRSLHLVFFVDFYSFETPMTFLRREVAVASCMISILASQCMGDNSEDVVSAKAKADRQLVLQQVRLPTAGEQWSSVG